MRQAALLAALLLVPALAGASVPAASAGPLERPWWVSTMMDVDQDGLDDALDSVLGTQVTVRVLVDYERMPSALDHAALTAAGATIVRGFDHFPILVVEADASRLRALADLPGVALVEKNDVVTLQLKESVPLTGAPQAWKSYGVTGKGITVAVIDDGAFEQHPDFEGKIAGHYDASSPTRALDPLGLLAPAGGSGHGTHVAGTIVGDGDESDGTYRGVAPDARFANVKVFSSANQTNSDLVLAGLDWTLNNADALGIRIASMSLGGRASDGTDAISRAVDIAVDKGLVVVAAAGNTGPGAQTIASPGSARNAITVGAVDKSKVVAGFSARGPTIDGRLKPDIVAPGVDITSTIQPLSVSGLTGLLSGSRELFYGPLSGTSMAAPHVAGVVALMLQANPELTPFEVKQMLLATAQDLGEKGADNDTGYGFVNAIAAVQIAKNPALLEQPRFQSVLATIPQPEGESTFERLSSGAQRIAGDTTLWLVLGGVVGAAVIAAVVVVVLRKRA